MKWKSFSDISIMTVLLIFIHATCIVGENPWARSENPDPDYSHITFRSGSFSIGSASDGVYSWSSWSTWSKCSRTCGGGVRSRSRVCRRRAGGGRSEAFKSCLGENTEYEVCNSEQCPTNAKDFRAYQCSQYNYGFYLGRHVNEWIAHESRRNPCELNCEAKGKEKFVYSFGKVIDGTRCSDDGQSMCVNGRCLPVGCDQRIGSGKKADMCGVCGGNNDTCVHYRSSFTGSTLARQGSSWRRRFQHGRESGGKGIYKEIAFVPAGSTNLYVEDKSKNHLALKTKDGSYEVKGLSGDYKVAGTIVKYDRTKEIDTMVAKGPTNDDLYIVAVLMDRHPVINYEFWVPKEKFHLLRTSNRPNAPEHPATSHHGRYGSSHHRAQPTTSTPSSVSLNKHHRESARPTSAPHHHHRSSTIEFGATQWTTRMTTPAAVQEVFFPQQDPRSRESSEFQLVEGGDATFFWKQKSSSPSTSSSPVNNRFWPSASGKDLTSVKPNIRNDKGKRQPTWSSTGQTSLSNEILINDNKTQWPIYKWNKGSASTGHKKIIPTPVSIFVLPPPKSGPSDGNEDEDKKYRKKDPVKFPSKEHCKPCKKVHNQLESYCNSDFVLRAEIVSFEYQNGETRYEIKVIQSYKNTVAILYKEYLWAPDMCRCPKLRVGREYIIMGRSDRNFRKNESRLLVDRTCFVRRFSPRRSTGLMRLRREANKKCNRIS